MTTIDAKVRVRRTKDALVLTFTDNGLLAELCGPHDQNVVAVEDRLGIDIHTRGNTLALRGDPHDVDLARQVFENLYLRLGDGLSIDNGDVEGALRVVAAVPNAKSGQAGAPELDQLTTIKTRKKTITARSPTQNIYLERLADTPLVFATGPAGTGKTYLAVAVAVSALERGLVSRIILSRPAVEAGESLGFLPGDVRDKVDPYLRPIFDSLHDCMGGAQVERGIETGQIEIAPLAFMRGRTLSDAFVILDEAQNSSPMQIKMFLTRLGENSRMCITGDPSQTDLPHGTKSGLSDALSIVAGLEEVAVVKFTAADVVRHPLVARIVQAYDAAGEGRRE
ncbi:MAG: PhoH family protein [Alphaproteobacteria bacterium]